jgi:hypothetical protein
MWGSEAEGDSNHNYNNSVGKEGMLGTFDMLEAQRGLLN